MLILVGQEEALGIVQSASAILTSILIFALAKYLHVRHRMTLITLAILIAIIGAGSLSIFYSALAVIFFIACQAVIEPFNWIAMNSHDPEKHYAYVCDQEMYLNIGRVVSILFFIALVHFSSQMLALRFTPLILVIIQIPLFFLAKSIEKHHKIELAVAPPPEVV